jgi:protocatechuate 3,4-dioxygenase beta subunit
MPDMDLRIQPLDIWTTQTRREFLRTLLVPSGFLVLATLGLPTGSTASPLPATPAIPDDDEEPTPTATAGPFYKPRSPQRSSFLEPGMNGEHILLTGLVLSRRGTPVSNALVDFWHADANGRYDNEGFTLRGHQFTDGKGQYSLRTIVPGLYPGRTRHFHVKVQAPKTRVLTTQLFFPGEPRNRTDFIFRSELLVSAENTPDGNKARFNFVLDIT